MDTECSTGVLAHRAAEDQVFSDEFLGDAQRGVNTMSLEELEEGVEAVLERAQSAWGTAAGLQAEEECGEGVPAGVDERLAKHKAKRNTLMFWPLKGVSVNCGWVLGLPAASRMELVF